MQYRLILYISIGVAIIVSYLSVFQLGYSKGLQANKPKITVIQSTNFVSTKIISNLSGDPYLDYLIQNGFLKESNKNNTEETLK